MRLIDQIQRSIDEKRTLASPLALAANGLTIVDCHPHIYAHDREAFPPIPDPAEHIEPASAEDLKAKMDASGVHKAVFIQTSSFYKFDNRYIVHATETHRDWATGVVTLDPDNPDDIQVLRAAAAAGCRGLRGLPDKNGRIHSPGVMALWGAAAACGMVVNSHGGEGAYRPLSSVPGVFPGRF